MKNLPAFAFAILFGSGAAAAEPLFVGVIAPTTGPVATVGVRQLSAIQWWAQDVNGKGGIKGRPVELVTCDDQGNPEVAVTCARDLIARHSLLILNTSVTGPVRATLPLVKDGPVEIVASPAIMPDPSTFVFQGLPTDLEMTKALLAYLKENKVTRLAMIAATDATGEVAVADMQQAIPASGITLALSRIDLKANDASIQLANVMKDNPQALYSSYSGGGAVTVVKSFSNLGLTIPLIVNNANATDAFISVVKSDLPPRLLSLGLRSMVLEDVTDPKTHAHVEYFDKSYAAWKHEPPDQLNQLGMLLADIADAVLRDVPDSGDPKAVKAFLESHPIDGVQTVHYSTTNHVGLTAENIAVVEYRDGHWAQAQPLK